MNDTYFMFIKNEYYNLNWEIIHDYHEEERERVLKEMKSWHREMSNNKDYRKLEMLQTEFNFHKEICDKCCHKYQHKYVSDFAEYIFANSSLNILPSNIPPPESFKNVDEVMEAVSRLRKTG